MSVKIMNLAWQVKGLEPVQKLILLKLADNANETDYVAWPSIETISEQVGCSTRTVQRHLGALEQLGLIRRKNQYAGSGRQKANLYHVLHPDLVGCQIDTPVTCVTPEGVTGVTPITLNHHNEPSLSKPLFGDSVDDAVDLYNETASRAGLSKVQKLTKARKQKLLQRLNDCGGIDGWKQALTEIENSSFLTGDNQRGWKADFDFLIQEKSFTRLMEGAYGCSKTRQQSDMEFLANYASEDLQ